MTIRWQSEIRDFPDRLGDLGLQDILDHCLQGFANIVNLRCFIWTREDSLRSDILLVILEHPLLQELEIDGRPSSFYHEMILSQFISLKRIKLIAPTPPVLEVLPEWLESLVNPLEHLSIVYKVNIIYDFRPIQNAELKTDFYRFLKCSPRTDF